MGEEKEKENKELVFKYGAYWNERCVPLCDVCYLSLVPGTEIHYAPVDFVAKSNCPEYAYCHNCGKSKMLYTDSGKAITIKEAIALMKAEMPVVKPECEEEETRSIGNGIILHNINDVLYEVDAIKARLDSMDMNIRENKNLLLSDIGWRVTVLSNDVKDCRAFLADNIAETKAEVKYGMTELSRELANAVNDLKELYLPIASSTQNKVAGSALLTCAFLLGGIITFTILSFLG